MYTYEPEDISTCKWNGLWSLFSHLRFLQDKWG